MAPTSEFKDPVGSHAEVDTSSAPGALAPAASKGEPPGRGEEIAHSGNEADDGVEPNATVRAGDA